MTSVDIFDGLKRLGFRISKVRRAMLEIFLNEAEPLPVIKIIEELRNRGLPVNKTTVYRELEFLLSQKLILEFDFGEGRKRYELNRNSHHHHLVCTNCNSVFELVMRDFEEDLEKLQKKLSEKNEFQIQDHSLEFFGICKKCSDLE